MSLKPQIESNDKLSEHIISKSSLHPYVNKCFYEEKISIPGANGLWIIFHSKCELKEGTKLIFYKVYSTYLLFYLFIISFVYIG